MFYIEGYITINEKNLFSSTALCARVEYITSFLGANIVKYCANVMLNNMFFNYLQL